MSHATVTLGAAAPATSTRNKAALIQGEQNYQTITESVCGIVERRAPRWWWIALACSSAVMSLGVFAAAYLISTGVGVWGLNQPVGWAFDITNFVFWIGIGHAGTLISAILLLFRQKWRTSINRFAEAMTIFAVACAGVFPAIHVGRVWMVWFFAPVPNSNAIWPNFRSPLLWDVMAVSTYATVSLLFWYVGMVPDLATLRDRATTRLRQIVYGLFALGWRGSARHWQNYEIAVLILAGLSTPLVLSVHTIVSFDFATSVIPGWHATLFPPYFVAGAIFSGFGMVLTLMIPCREIFDLKHLVTPRHLDLISKVLLATGLMVGYAYGVEFFTAWYSGNQFEQFAFTNRAFGPYAWAYWIMVSCNVLVPQVLWSSRVRQNAWGLFFISILVNVGMWFERFVIIVTSLHRDYLPSSWGLFYPTWVDAAQMIGSFGLFFTLFLLFLRFIPMIAMFEVKANLPESTSSTKTEAGANGDGESRKPEHEASGLLASFPTAAQTRTAVRQLRDGGYQVVDAFSPFPIHGMPKALGLKRSHVPPLVLGAGLVGLVFAVGGMLYLNVSVYPLVTGGKPYGAIEPLVPIIFEVAILFAALAAVGGMLALNGLPQLVHPLFARREFARVTNDGFFVLVDARDDNFDWGAARQHIHEMGGELAGEASDA